MVFKSLIVLHTLMRSGSLDPTFSYLSTSALSLSNHDAPNIAAYASYLAARIKSYANLKRDVIRDKSDRRAASRLRTLGVEQGLLREVREVQRMIASLVESKVSPIRLHAGEMPVADADHRRRLRRSSTSTTSTTTFR